MVINESRRSRAHFDLPLLIMVYALAIFGVLSVSVATFSVDSEIEDTLLNYIVSSYYGMRQTIFLLVSPLVLGVLINIPAQWIHRFSSVVYIGACGLLIVALLGKAAGVKAWIDMLWGYTLQPSEFVKLACILSTAKYLEKNTEPLTDMKSWLNVMWLMGIPWGLTLLQGEMGSVLVSIFVFGIMMYFGGVRYRTIGIVVAVGGIALVLLYAYMVSSGSDSYRLERILSFIDPNLVDEGASYQVNNSKIAIGSGGLYGRGTFVQGSFSQLDYVPEDWTDFIFSTIGEAFGFVGCTAVVLLYMLIVLRLMYLARYTADRFGQMCIIGVMAMMLFHVFENVGMTTGLMPVTGIPLPFLSYGGSNLITNMLGIGLVLNITKHRSVVHMSGGYTPQMKTTQKWAR